MAIKGIKLDGDWTSDPVKVKDVFFDYISNKFQPFHSSSIRQPSSRFRQLSELDAEFISKVVTREEIKIAVWECGSDKAPGPDGFNFCFIKRYWEILKDDICCFVEEFFF